MRTRIPRRELAAHLGGWNSTWPSESATRTEHEGNTKGGDRVFSQCSGGQNGFLLQTALLRARGAGKGQLPIYHRVTAQMVKELKDVMTSMMEERTEELSIKNMEGDTFWPKPTFEQSQIRKACYRLLGDWHKAITSIVSLKIFTAEVDVVSEYWKSTVSLRKRDSGEQARAAIVITRPSEHVFSAELVAELMASTTESEVRETISKQRTAR